MAKEVAAGYMRNTLAAPVSGLTEAPLSPKAIRGSMTQIMFENFNDAVMYVAMLAVLYLSTSGHTTVCGVGLGRQHVHLAPDYESYALYMRSCVRLGQQLI